MKAPATGLSLLLGDADDGKPTLDSKLPDDYTGGQSAPVVIASQFLTDLSRNSNDLKEHGWGIIAPEGAVGDRLLQIIAPLINHRREQQGGRPVRILRAPAKIDHAEVSSWRQRCYADVTDLDVELPHYQLILGNLDQVGLSIQQIQGTEGFVGRLAFDAEQGYEAYVDKVLRQEKSSGTHEQGRALFVTNHDRSGATNAGYQSLITPGLEIARQGLQRGQFPACQIEELGDQGFSSRQELTAAAAKSDPSVLFTLSHGAGAPRSGWKSAAEQHARQGAMVFESDGNLTGQDLARSPFLPGGIWFMLASYSAGTAETSAYRKWLESMRQVEQFSSVVDEVLKRLPRQGDRPFIANLPQAVLQNPDGPLAFIGHVDLAWTYSFAELDAAQGQTHRPARFISVVRSLLRGDRCGSAFRELTRLFSQTCVQLANLYHRPTDIGQAAANAAADAQRGHLWMLRHDLAGYVLLGDPAVRLPLLSPAVKTAPPMSNPDLMSILGFAAAPSKTAAAAPAQAPEPSSKKLQ